MSAIRHWNKTLIIITLWVFFIILSIIVLPQVIFNIELNLLDTPEKPEVKYGEFPFWIEYEINGEKFKIEDSVICKYKGVSVTANGKERNWETTLEKGERDSALLLTDGNRRIYCYVGEASYYMGDFETYGKTVFYPKVFYEEYNGGITSSANKDILDKYNIRILGYEFSKPIKNSFIK